MDWTRIGIIAAVAAFIIIIVAAIGALVPWIVGGIVIAAVAYFILDIREGHQEDGVFRYGKVKKKEETPDE